MGFWIVKSSVEVSGLEVISRSMLATESINKITPVSSSIDLSRVCVTTSPGTTVAADVGRGDDAGST